MKRNLARKTYAELRYLDSHYREIFPKVKERAKPLILWYIRSLRAEMDRRWRAYALLKRTNTEIVKVAS